MRDAIEELTDFLRLAFRDLNSPLGLDDFVKILEIPVLLLAMTIVVLVLLVKPFWRAGRAIGVWLSGRWKSDGTA